MDTLLGFDSVIVVEACVVILVVIAQLLLGCVRPMWLDVLRASFSFSAPSLIIFLVSSQVSHGRFFSLSHTHSASYLAESENVSFHPLQINKLYFSYEKYCNCPAIIKLATVAKGLPLQTINSITKSKKKLLVRAPATSDFAQGYCLAQWTSTTQSTVASMSMLLFPRYRCRHRLQTKVSQKNAKKCNNIDCFRT